MSFHGGIAGLVIAIYILCQKRKIKFLYCLDLIACVAPIGIFLGRIANFINAELYGRQTNSALGIVFPNAGNIARHPSQIYEALTEGALLFAIMIFFRYKTDYKLYHGRLSGIFMLGYAVFRYITEEFREPDYHLGLIMGSYTIGQILSIPILIVGVALILYSGKDRNL